jgi:hypothetical protein
LKVLPSLLTVATFLSISSETVESSQVRMIWPSLSAGTRASPADAMSTPGTASDSEICPSVARRNSSPSAAVSFRQDRTGVVVRDGTTAEAMARASTIAVRSQVTFRCAGIVRGSPS